MFEEVEEIIKKHSYNMIMFLDMFKEIDQIKYNSNQIYKIANKYPLCDNLDLQIDDGLQKIQQCKDLLN